MALPTPLHATRDEVREALRPLRNDVSIAVFASGNAFSVGAIIRVAHSFLVREIVVIGGEGWYEKASMGMHRFENVVRVADEGAFFAHVAGRPVWALEKDRARRGLYDVRGYPRDVVLVVGSERGGVPPTTLDRADEIVGIPLYGVNHSLPVAVAAGIALSDWARRRYAEGTLVTAPREG